MEIERGSVWTSYDGRTFQVITETHIEGHDWIHYRRIDSEYDEPKEFSCYKESFLSRFTKLPTN
jgi:hypothetical protein